ncbi:anaerobic glycerol-3-phosphate dehydrogenase subunit GlpB [Muribaculum intestinale]|uniref:anaerobic glycerol-3-phosphate dehydrogenase subunit GlpB n=1 Tax=Muribaculum intestinale TaxID=1796646 RepID=UPI00272C38F0|nr:anaerobic glycerol-3-phosphate dehydrogenase subunit GlpB [Muribaculum intestinale]
MRYDTIIIGGGMGGLVTGINLLRQGQKVAVISAGQSALHFNSGSFGLYGRHNGEDITDNPLDYIKGLPETHPYSKVGIDNILKYIPQVKPLFEEVGVTLHGDEKRNHYRLTPIGMLKPAWLSMEGYATADSPAPLSWGKALLVNIQGYLDFYPQFLSRGLEKAGLKVESRTFTLDSLQHLRKSATEMRATNIARVLDGNVLRDVARHINRFIDETDATTVIMPAVIGMFDESPIRLLQEQVKVPVRFISTIPMSVGGMRAQMKLRTWFHQHGGTYLLGDIVTRGTIDGGRVKEIYTANLADMPLAADNFVIASGSFLSHGLEANPDSVYEPIFGLDVVADPNRPQWCDPDLYKEQSFEHYGIATDSSLRVSHKGSTLDNLFAAGAVIGGCNALKEESGAGVTLMTAFKVADQILNSKKGGKQ